MEVGDVSLGKTNARACGLGQLSPGRPKHLMREVRTCHLEAHRSDVFGQHGRTAPDIEQVAGFAAQHVEDDALSNEIGQLLTARVDVSFEDIMLYLAVVKIPDRFSLADGRPRRTAPIHGGPSGLLATLGTAMCAFKDASPKPALNDYSGGGEIRIEHGNRGAW